MSRKKVDESKGKSLKWLSVANNSSGRELNVYNSAESVFGTSSRQKCNIISIFGGARQGKSFLMNCLAGESDIFQV